MLTNRKLLALATVFLLAVFAHSQSYNVKYFVSEGVQKVGDDSMTVYHMAMNINTDPTSAAMEQCHTLKNDIETDPDNAPVYLNTLSSQCGVEVSVENFDEVCVPCFVNMASMDVPEDVAYVYTLNEPVFSFDKGDKAAYAPELYGKGPGVPGTSLALTGYFILPSGVEYVGIRVDDGLIFSLETDDLGNLVSSQQQLYMTAVNAPYALHIIDNGIPVYEETTTGGQGQLVNETPSIGLLYAENDPHYKAKVFFHPVKDSSTGYSIVTYAYNQSTSTLDEPMDTARITFSDSDPSVLLSDHIRIEGGLPSAKLPFGWTENGWYAKFAYGSGLGSMRTFLDTTDVKISISEYGDIDLNERLQWAHRLLNNYQGNGDVYYGLYIGPDSSYKGYRVDFDANVDEYNNSLFMGDHTYQGLVGSTVEDAEPFPTDVFRTDACFVGWMPTRDYEGEILAETLTDLTLDEFAEELASIHFENEEEDFFKLYAKWDESCTPETETIALEYAGGDSLGEVSLWQYNVGIHHKFKKTSNGYELKIPKLDLGAMLDFEVYVDGDREVADSGIVFSYTYTDTDGEAERDSTVNLKLNYGSLISIVHNYEIEMRDMKLTVSFRPLPVEVIFNENAGDDNVFYRNFDRSQQLYADETEPLETTLFRAGYCLDGWGLAPDAEEFYTKPSDIIAAAEPGADSIAVYAIWSESNGASSCGASETFTLVTSAHGSVKLSHQVNYEDPFYYKMEPVSGSSYTYQMQVPTGVGFAFYTEVEPEEGYVVYRASYVNGTQSDYSGENVVSQWISFYEDPAELRVLFKSSGPYNFTLSPDLENATDYNAVFLAAPRGVYQFSSQSKLYLNEGIPTLYDASNYTYTPWNLNESPAQRTYVNFDADLLDSVELYDSYKMTATWEPLTANDAAFNITTQVSGGEVLLVQEINGKTVEHSITAYNGDDSALVLPILSDFLGYSFRLKLVPNEGNVLDQSVLVTMNGDYAGYNETAYNDGDTITLFPYGGRETYAVNINAQFGKKLKLVFDENTKSTDVYYGSEWTPFKEIVASENYVYLPTLYSNEGCVEGWSVKPTAEKADFENSARGEELLSALESDMENVKSSYTLYAYWTERDSCQDYKQLRYESGKHGTIELEEALVSYNEESGEDSVDIVIHRFAQDSVMLLPRYFMMAGWYVHAVPDSGYKLDSVRLEFEGLDTLVFLNGDLLMPPMNGGSQQQNYDWFEGSVKLRAYFSEGEQEEIHYGFDKAELRLSGNAFQLNLSTKGKAMVYSEGRAVLMDALGVVMDSTEWYVDSVPDLERWEKRDLKPGRYVVNAKIRCPRGVDVFERAFDVSPNVAEACDNCWQMISLESAEIDSLDKDDAVVYWWDETSNYGLYWQYQSFSGASKPVAGRGYWYNSLEGRELAIKKGEKLKETDRMWKLDSVYSGWNLVANPYPWYIDAYASGLDSTAEIYYWNAAEGDYVGTRYIGPYAAVWIKAKEPMEIDIPYEHAFVVVVDSTGETWLNDDENGMFALDKPKMLAKANGMGDWSIQAVLSDDRGHRDSWNVLGVAASAWEREAPPEGMGDRVDLSIVEGKKSLAKSFRAVDAAYEWTLDLSASSTRKGYLTFEGLEELRGMGYSVFVTVDGATNEMLPGKALPVLLKSNATQARVQVTAGKPKLTVVSSLGELRGLQTGNALEVSFTASEPLQGQEARVQLVSLKGEVVAAASTRTQAGANRVRLETSRSGLFLLHVRVGNLSKSAKIVIK